MKHLYSPSLHSVELFCVRRKFLEFVVEKLQLIGQDVLEEAFKKVMLEMAPFKELGSNVINILFVSNIGILWGIRSQPSYGRV